MLRLHRFYAPYRSAVSHACLGALLIGAGSDALRAQAISAKTQEQCLAVLRDGLRSSEFWPSMHAAEALADVGHADEVRDALAGRLDKEPNGKLRCGLARELVRAGDREQVKVLAATLQDPVVEHRIAAAESLFKVTQIGDEQQLRNLAASDPNVDLQLMALGALARQGDALSLAGIRRQLSNHNEATRKIAIWLLARLGTSDDIEPLRRAKSQESDAVTRGYADYTLAALKDESGIQSLKSMVSCDKAELRGMAAEAAGIAGARQLGPQLTKMLSDKDLDVRIRAAQALLVLAQQ